LVLADVDDVVEDQQMILVELGEGAFKGEFTACEKQGKRPETTGAMGLRPTKEPRPRGTATPRK
jgi:hypothetical protein